MRRHALLTTTPSPLDGMRVQMIPRSLVPELYYTAAGHHNFSSAVDSTTSFDVFRYEGKDVTE